MSGLSSNKGVCLGLILAGVGLSSVAMFLHPMSPEDFLSLSLSDPLQTVAGLYGRVPASLFWSGVLVGMSGLPGFAVRFAVALRRSLHLDSRHRLPAH
ncbi:MAG TPA: hypothetical protein VF450_01085 [Noviherbaspirillum sp.]